MIAPFTRFLPDDARPHQHRLDTSSRLLMLDSLDAPSRFVAYGISLERSSMRRTPDLGRDSLNRPALPESRGRECAGRDWGGLRLLLRTYYRAPGRGTQPSGSKRHSLLTISGPSRASRVPPAASVLHGERTAEVGLTFAHIHSTSHCPRPVNRCRTAPAPH